MIVNSKVIWCPGFRT